MSDADDYLCPSASSDWDDAKLLGIVVGSAERPRVRYTPPVPVDGRLLDLVPPDLLPEELFRFTARCRGEGCPQFVGGACGVAKAAVRHLEEEGEWSLPACGIRVHCRWWADEGPAACRRCETVVTADTARAGTAYAAAMPFSPPGSPGPRRPARRPPPPR